MKHNLHSIANGQNTPPCGTSRSKSSNFILTSLLVFLMTFMGSGNVWADNITFQGSEIFYFDPVSNSGWGTVVANDADVYLEFANSGNNATKSSAAQWEVENSILKVTVPSGTYNQVRIVRGQKGNPSSIWNTFDWITLQTGKNQILNGGSWATYGGGSGGGGSDPEPTQTNWSFRGDMWLNGTGDNAGWLGGSDSKVPHFMDDHNGNITCSFIYPNAQCRLTLCENGSDKTSDRCDGTTNLTKTGWNPNKYTFAATGGVKKYTFTLNESTGHFTAKAEDYPVQKTGWHVFMSAGDGDPTAVGTITEEAGLVISNVASGNHNLYITDGSSTTIAGVNWFGGLYIDKTNSDVAWATQREYYGDSKFSSATFPIKAKRDATGRFKLNEAGDIIVAFDGGKITINKYTAPAPAATYTVTIHPNNGGSNIVRENVPEGSNSSAAALNLSAITYGAGTATWYTNEACTTPFSTVTSDMDLYAKWGVSGNFYFVSCLQTANDDGGSNGNWSNGYGQKLSYTFVAPSGHMPFEVIKDKDWGQKINGGNYDGMFDNSKSNVTISASNGHMDFTLDAPKQVTVSYDGKVAVNVADYTFDNSKTWRIKTSWGNGGNAWNYNTLMTNNGTTNATAILRNVPAGQNSFVVTTRDNDNDAMATVGTETFNALYVDTSNPSSGLTWNNTSARRDGSDNFNSTTPQTDNRWRNCSFSLSQISDIRITFDGGKIRCDILPKYTVTFDSNGGSEVASQTLFEGLTASEPSTPSRPGYNFVKWQLNGVDYIFSSAVNADITLDAVWTPKTLESISLDESSIVMVMGGSNATLTPSYLPTDLIAGQQPTYDWSVSPSGVVTVEGGVITAVAEGTATVTCTAHGTDKSANCVVTVKDCNTEPTDIFSYTLGSDPTGIAAGSAVMNGMFDEADNTEPANLTKVRLALGNSNDYKYVYDPNTGVGSQLKYGDNNTDYAYWYRIEAGQTASSIQIYVLKNVGTGKYLAKAEGGGTGNWDWVQAITANTADDNTAKWHLATSSDQRLMNLEKSDGNGSYSKQEYFLHRYNVNNSNTTTNQTVVVGGSDGDQGNGELKFNFRDAAEVANPAYMHSPVSGYYRFATGASVVATLNRAIKVNDVIRLEVKNPSEAAVSATVTIGSQVENINLAAGTTTTEEITVTDANRPTSITIASNDVNFMLKSVVVNREMPNPGKDPNLAWGATPSAAHQVAAGDISDYIATRSGAGLITYTSSDEFIATVAADGTVHPIAEGTVTITATLEQDGCYNGGTINYSLTLNDLPKPTITLTVPDAAVPQGSVQTISASQDGNGVLSVSILSGSDATLTDNGNGTYTLRLGDNASNIVIEAATTRTLTYAQHAVTETVAVTNCAPDGRIIYSYTLSGHDELNAAEAEGGTYSQANLASVGTDDNPKTVSKVRIGLGNQNSLQYVYDPNTALGNHIDYGSGNTDDYYWYVIPKGMTNSSIQKFALKNASTGYYLAKAAGGGTGNWDWVQAISANSCDANTAQWHWAISYTNNNHPRLMNMDRSNGDGSFNKPEYFLHRNTSANNGVSKVVVGSSDGDQGNGELNAWFTDETNANNPDYFYSVENDNHTYYILNGGTVSVSRASAFKAGDVITLNVFNRGAAAGSTIKVAENTIETNVNGAAALQYTVAEGDGIQGQNNFVITPLNGYICLNSISIFRPKDEDEFTNPTLTWDADLSAQQMIDMNNSETGMTHAITNIDAPVNAVVSYSVSPAAKADINSATGALTLTGEAQNKDVLTVTATLPAIGCYNQAVASYEIYVKNLATPTLSATFGTLQQGYVSTLTVITNSDAVPALSSISGFALDGDPVHEDNTYTYNIVVGSTAEAVSVHVALAETADYLAYAIDAADENVTTSSLAQLYENTPAEGTLVLEADYNEGLVIDKIITINGDGHSIGNLTVENSGDLTLSGNLTVNDFTICAKAGNTDHQGESGQVRDADKLTVNGNAYFLYTVDPSGQVQYGWYDFTVPFPVNVMSGIKGIQDEVLKEDFANEVDYAIMEFLGDKLAEGQYSYKKFRGVMQPNKLYSITLDASANYNTVRFQKTADGALLASQSVTLEEHTAASDTRANWNGVGNGTLHHADAGVSADYIQVYQSGDKTFLPVPKNEYSLVVGSAFMVQETGTMTLSQATHNQLLAPRRSPSVPATVIRIAPEGKTFTDQLFISADAMNGGVYTQGVDVAKAGTFGSASVPQIGTNAYNTLLCAHEAQQINGKARYDLSLYAPAEGSYTLTSMRVPENKTLYLTWNGKAIWNLSIADTYTLDLDKGTTTEYGLLIVENYQMPTDFESIQQSDVSVQKVVKNGILYILRNGEVFDAQGARVK